MINSLPDNESSITDMSTATREVWFDIKTSQDSMRNQLLKLFWLLFVVEDASNKCRMGHEVFREGGVCGELFVKWPGQSYQNLKKSFFFLINSLNFYLIQFQNSSGSWLPFSHLLFWNNQFWFDSPLQWIHHYHVWLKIWY